jgi:membrane protease YdiL (CAAX protease family)
LTFLLTFPETIMTFADHLFVFVLAIVHPIVGYVSFKRLLRRIEAGEIIDRTKLYLTTIMGHWFLFALALVLWISQERSWSALGFGLTTDTWFMVGAVLTVAGVVLLLLQIRQMAATDTDEVRSIRGRIGNLEIILPRNGNELGRFYGLSLTAGIVEETLWRGFMIWYFSQFLPLWAAALISTIGFGLAHAYQGIKNLPRVTLVGAAFAGLYVLTGSLWLPMVLHAAVDILQGRLAYDVIRRCDSEAPPTDDDSSEAIASSAS